MLKILLLIYTYYSPLTYLKQSKYYSDIFDEATEKSKNPKAVSNWLMSDIARILNEKEEEADKIPFTGKELGELVEIKRKSKEELLNKLEDFKLWKMKN